MDGMLKNFVIMCVVLAVGAGILYYCDKENIDLCFEHEGKEWCIVKNEDD